ncbi:hypothetical protein V475_15610 [Sphingobium baderi LL03]|nr:hypothetical protein V475_15610 [Sphingobium baderi LL03]
MVSLSLLSACQGPEQKAGAEKDKAAAEAAGQPYSGDGPNERVGSAREEEQFARSACSVQYVNRRR